MLHLNPPIRTDRLVLRQIDPISDVDAIHAYASREDVCRYIPWLPKTRVEVATWLPNRCSIAVPEPDRAAFLAVVVHETDELIGDVMFRWESEAHGCAEIGYVIHPDHAGHGYASEAAAALLRLAFEQLDLHRVVARTDQRNHASAAVLRRIGMRQEAVFVEGEWFKDQWSTEIDFAMLQSEWRAARPARSTRSPHPWRWRRSS